MKNKIIACLVLCLSAAGITACGPETALMALDQQYSKQAKIEQKERALYASAVDTKALMYNGKRVEVLTVVKKHILNADLLVQCEVKLENGIRLTLDGSDALLAPASMPR